MVLILSYRGTRNKDIHQIVIFQSDLTVNLVLNLYNLLIFGKMYSKVFDLSHPTVFFHCYERVLISFLRVQAFFWVTSQIIGAVLRCFEVKALVSAVRHHFWESLVGLSFIFMFLFQPLWILCLFISLTRVAWRGRKAYYIDSQKLTS